jgi:hypothetical protein
MHLFRAYWMILQEADCRARSSYGLGLLSHYIVIPLRSCRASVSVERNGDGFD